MKPKDLPLEQWPPGWLKMEVGSLLGDVFYIILTDTEKRKKGYPVTVEEMRAFIEQQNTK